MTPRVSQYQAEFGQFVRIRRMGFSCPCPSRLKSSLHGRSKDTLAGLPQGEGASPGVQTGPNSLPRTRTPPNASTDAIADLANQAYKYGFSSPIESDTVPPGLSEDTVRLISKKKGEPEW